MEHGQPSRTALVTAYSRAYHQMVDEPRLFTDPLAVRILGVDEAVIAERHSTPSDQPGDTSDWPRRRRIFLAARARFAEDTVAAAVAAGTRQVVIVGAGLDTFAYRNPFPEVRVFEVDHPDTQEWKRWRLAESEIPVPDSVTFVPIDFETRTLATGLAEAGFDREKPAVFVWLGVIMYLTREAIQSTLEYIATQAHPAQVAFDYISPGNTEEERAAMRVRAERVSAVGEPFLSFFTQPEMAEVLRAAGFTDIQDFAAMDVVADLQGKPRNPQSGNPPRIVRAGR
ncbi:SAM-dependent methyltransferase [Nocardia sp. SYP-A9097]|uniref:class I SAM-dependent methyltransferase n=1 Tax=Nocardia sp. SYP-A9097 TaxID=2663237 RepID=UPI00129B4380|nr:class I SAM-dependent methyltransferase [Nocardia sp. SYP-A9097]MRH89473.1 SAM-dependent methyltransferase [Nocardia sp. SYP-A9097]